MPNSRRVLRANCHAALQVTLHKCFELPDQGKVLLLPSKGETNPDPGHRQPVLPWAAPGGSTSTDHCNHPSMQQAPDERPSPDQHVRSANATWAAASWAQARQAAATKDAEGWQQHGLHVLAVSCTLQQRVWQWLPPSSAFTLRGSRTSGPALLPRPSCPRVLFPQAHRAPDWASSRVKWWPAAACKMGSGTGTS